MRRCVFSVIMILLFGLIQVQAREINSREDLVRLRGWGEKQKEDKIFEKERLSDLLDVFKEREAWEKQKQSALQEYLKERSKQKAALDESSPEYKEEQKVRREARLEHEQSRQNFIRERNLRRAEEKATINLTEERELGIDQEPPRVAWEKRRFYPMPGKAGVSGSSSSGRFSGAPEGSAGEAPPPEFISPPPPPPPDFFEAEPPPPPPPIFENGPGGMDDMIPPPVFDGDF